MKSEVAEINAIPSKRLFLSIIADYSLITAISELIDNVVDSKFRNGLKQPARVKVTLDCDDQSITITDDAGGVAETNLAKLITPGGSLSDGSGASIGIFGVGSKRAAVALARDIKIATRHGRDKFTYLVEYDESWLLSESWNLPYYKTDQLPVGTTRIIFSRLRSPIDIGKVDALKQNLSANFAKFIKSGDLIIEVDDQTLSAIEPDNWSYPEGYEPKSFVRTFNPLGKNLPIKAIITSGLTLNRGQASSRYGVYFYCNKRLVCRASKDIEFGFQAGMAGMPHASMSNAQVVVELIGSAADMPWNSSKTGINFNHPVFRSLQLDIQVAVKNSTALSRRFWPEYETCIAPFKAGNIAVETLPRDGRITGGKLPPVPPANKNKDTSLAKLNEKLASSKPWIIGAYESMMAVDIIKGKKAFQQKNRICLIIIDSMLEIAFKDFLAHDAPSPMSESKLQALFGNRIDVHKEVEKHILTGDYIWKKLNYYYKQRCELVHKRASVSVSDEEIDNFSSTAKKILTKMFGLKFPS